MASYMNEKRHKTFLLYLFKLNYLIVTKLIVFTYFLFLRNTTTNVPNKTLKITNIGVAELMAD